MKVLIINPQTISELMRELYGHHENLGINLIGAYLESENFEVKYVDQRIQKLTSDEVIDYVLKEEPSIVMFGVNYVTMKSALVIAQLIKIRKKDIYVVFGGEHATYLDKEIMEACAFVDCVIRGEGEETALCLCKSIEMSGDLEAVKGITYRCDGKVKRNENRYPISNLDKLPFASKYLVHKALEDKIPIEVGILAQRGCPFNCSFCNAFRFFSNEFKLGNTRSRSPQNVVDEMELLKPIFEDNHKMILHFYDATFITKSKSSRSWIYEFIKLLEERKIKIPFDAFIRADSFDFNKEEDIELIEQLKGVGLVGTYLGLEAGDDEVLELYNKKVKSDESKHVFAQLSKYGIEGSTNGVICFHQTVIVSEIENTINFLKKIGFCTLWNIASKAETLPGIELAKDMELSDRKNLWDIKNYEFVDEKVKNMYEIISYILDNYYVAQYEDRIVRWIRDQLKLVNFYKMDDIAISRCDVETKIENIQNITYSFFIKLIAELKKEKYMSVSDFKPEIVKYVNNLYAGLEELTDLCTNIL